MGNQKVAVLAKKLPGETFKPITRDRIAHFAAGGNTQSTSILRIGLEQSNEMPCLHLFGTPQTLEVGSLEQSIPFGETVPCGWRILFQFRCLCFVRRYSIHPHLKFNYPLLRRQSLASLGPTPIDDQASGFGGHAFSESMRSCPFNFAGLIRSFHFHFPC